MLVWHLRLELSFLRDGQVLFRAPLPHDLRTGSGRSMIGSGEVKERQWKGQRKAVGRSKKGSGNPVKGGEKAFQKLRPWSSSSSVWSCAVRDANMGHQLAGGNSSWCPELESRTTHRSDDSTLAVVGAAPAVCFW